MTSDDPRIRRRTLLAGTAVVAVSPVLGACGSDDGGGDDAGSGGDGGTGSEPISVPAADVEVGGGVITEDAVVTQPTAGTFRAFDPTCTHNSCAVSSVEEGAIICSCHDSAYDIDTGEPIENPQTGRKGPAPRGLSAFTATLEGDQVVVT